MCVCVCVFVCSIILRDSEASRAQSSPLPNNCIQVYNSRSLISASNKVSVQDSCGENTWKRGFEYPTDRCAFFIQNSSVFQQEGVTMIWVAFSEVECNSFLSCHDQLRFRSQRSGLSATSNGTLFATGPTTTTSLCRSSALNMQTQAHTSKP